MNVNTSRYCIITMVIICLASFCMINNNIEATEEVTNTSLKVICQTEDIILSGMEWNLYRIGSNIGDNDYSLEGDFKEYSVSLKNLSTSEMLDVANTLENYTILDNISPLDNGVTDEFGIVTFADLKVGLYLLSGKSIIIDDKKYIPSATLIEVEEDSQGYFQLTSYPKFTVKTISNEIIEYTVKKMWLNDDAYLNHRPNDIEVELYQNEKLFETVFLNDDNGWSYSWSSLDSDEWRVKEVGISKYYTVIYRTNGVMYLIVNSHKDGTGFNDTVNISINYNSNSNSNFDFDTDFTTASISETLTTDEILTTDETLITGETSTTDETSSKFTENSTDNSNYSNDTTSNSDIDKLPQTGQLWWPVPIFIVSGLVLIAVGVQLKSNK